MTDATYGREITSEIMQNTNHDSSDNEKPIVIFTPAEKYTLVGDVRMHNMYDPAAEPVFTTFRVTRADEENTELTLVTTLVGDPEHVPDDITNADRSPDTLTNPAPVTAIVCPVPLSTGITLGDKEDTDTMSNTPASK